MGKINKDGKIILVFLFLAGVINYLDRSALSVAAPFIQSDLHLTPGQMGIILVVFPLGMQCLISLGA